MIHLFDIDNQISILMVTTPPVGPGEDGGPLGRSTMPTQPFTSPIKEVPFEKGTPFGGSRPEY